MPIPNITTLYQRINSGAEGGHEFARFMKLLLGADYSAQGINFISESDASGDYKKIDAYIPGDNDFPENIIGFQFKFYPSRLSNKHKHEIIHSLEAALRENEFIQEYILVTPEDFMKEQSTWFESLKITNEKNYWKESNGLYRKCGLVLKHWGHSKIIELALKHDHIGYHYFSELYPIGVGKFKLSKVAIDPDICAWLPSKHDINAYYPVSIEEKDNVRTSDPVFDFQFKNSTNEIHLLHRIEIHIEKIWSTLKGIPTDQLLRSVGTIEYKIDFSQPVNIINFSEPFIFEANSPKRFKLQLNDFSHKCPGNWAIIKFWFYFDETIIPTNSFLMNM